MAFLGMRLIVAIALAALVAGLVPLGKNSLAAAALKTNSVQSLPLGTNTWVDAQNPFAQAKSQSLQAVERKSGESATALHAAAAEGPGETVYIPDMERRRIMNLILVSSIGVSTLGLAVPYLYFFYPGGSGGGGGATVAQDELGIPVKQSAWLAAHNPDDRSLVQGLNGDATYLIVTQDKTLETFALNAVCTHLGCVVPWNKVENKFMCPCHGSQYNSQGKVVRGPAPLSLALAHVNVKDDDVTFTSWTETDFRNGEAPWWKA